MKISSFPEGKYFGPNYFHNSNEKSGKPNFHDIMIITAFFPIKSKEYEGGRFIFDPSPLDGVAVGQKIEPIAGRASGFTFRLNDLALKIHIKLKKLKVQLD